MKYNKEETKRRINKLLIGGKVLTRGDGGENMR